MAAEIKRRDFMKMGMAGAGLTIGATSSKVLGYSVPQAQLETVRVGFVGVGMQGSSHVRNLLRVPGVQLKAICDIREERAMRIVKRMEEEGQPKPALYTRGDDDFRRMCDEEDLDLVYTATPWRWHAPVLMAAMKAGKNAATEVPIGATIEECWELVETAEKTGLHCVMMENCCYDRVELMTLNMVRKGLLGDLLHAKCGYLHDLRALKLDPKGYQGMWRIKHSIERDGDLYPTHGIGPVAQCMNINRGNQFDHLVSMSTNPGGVKAYASEHYGADNKYAQAAYALGDVVTTMVRTKGGQTIVITHDTNTPRAYSRDFLVQGTKGVLQKYPEPKIFVEGRGQGRGHRWENLSGYEEEYEHPLWKAMQEKSKGAGHGGMDYIEDYRLIECLRTGQPTDADVYDGASWSAITGLSEQSIAGGSKPIDCPDFTRGQWKSRPPLGIIEG